MEQPPPLAPEPASARSRRRREPESPPAPIPLFGARTVVQRSPDEPALSKAEFVEKVRQSNQACHDGDFHTAIVLYNEALAVDPQNCILYSNRSAAYMKTQQYHKALDDAIKARLLNPKWPKAKQFESKIIKSCPECQIMSNFVILSEYWVEEKEEKQKLIQKYKEAMSNKACRYFDEGRGSCPFGGNCFYKHVYPDGRTEEPQRQKVGTLSRYRAQQRSHFWELIEERENNPFDNEEEQVVTFELGEMFMLLAAGRDEDDDEELTDSEDEWDLFHCELEDFYDLAL